MNKFNLSLDDFSPHSRAGLDFESIKWCNNIINVYPDFKVNLFIPAAYCRLGEKPCYLSANLEWVNKVKALPLNYRINLHGFYHRRTDKRFPASNNDEFQFLNELETNKLLEEIEDEFIRANLSFVKTLRPPGWKISRQAEIALHKKGIKLASRNQVNWDLVTVPPNDGNIIAYGHTSNWTNNFMNEERCKIILDFLHNKKFDFCFLEDVYT